MTVKQGVDEFLMWKATYLPPKTIRSYTTVLKILTSYYGEKKMSSFGQVDLYRFVQYLKKYDDGYVFNILTILKLFVRYFYPKETHIRPDTIVPRRKIVDTPFVTKEEVDYLCEFLSERIFKDLRTLVLVKIMFTSGMRVGEVLSLKIGDLTNDRGAIIYTEKRRGVKRPVMWSKETNKLLIKYLGIRLSMDCQDDHIFVSRSGRVLSSRSVERDLKKICEISDSPRITPHTLRHGFAHYHLMESGLSTKLVGDMLGHSPNNNTSAMQYLRLDFGEKIRVLRRYI